MTQEVPPMPAMTPMLTVTDVRATLDWFGRLGFATVVAMPMPDGSLMHAEVTRGDDVRVMLGPAMPEMGAVAGGAGVTLYVTVTGENVDGIHAQAAAAGVSIVEGLTDQFWGDRTFVVQHPDGVRVMFAQKVRDVTPAEMQQAMAGMAPA